MITFIDMMELRTIQWFSSNCRQNLRLNFKRSKQMEVLIKHFIEKVNLADGYGMVSIDTYQSLW